MSKNYLDKILLKTKKVDHFFNYKPAGPDDNYHCTNEISYNIVNFMTLFKNKEIQNSELNRVILGNLSFLITKRNLTQKKLIIKQKKQNHKNYSNKNIITNSNKVQKKIQ